MRTLIMFVFTLGMMTPAFAGVLTERDRGHEWFQNCEEEIAKPFCGTLKIQRAVEALSRQWSTRPDLDSRVLGSLEERLPTTSSSVPHDSPEILSPANHANDRSGGVPE